MPLWSRWREDYFYHFEEVKMEKQGYSVIFFLIVETTENKSNYGKQFSGGLFYTAYRMLINTWNARTKIFILNLRLRRKAQSS